VPPIRTVRSDELCLLPDLESRADTMFERLGIGPLPGPGTVEEFADALVVLVAGDPPLGLCRIDAVGEGAHLEQLSVDPESRRRGIGRALLRAGCAWAADNGYDELTLATYRDVPWNGPFYASEGFVEDGPVDDWLRSRGLAPEEPVMGRFGARVLMRRRL
jgi:GNAT superfamily N-acetyltransferase